MPPPAPALVWGEEARGQGKKELAAQGVYALGKGWFGPQVPSETHAGRPLRKGRREDEGPGTALSLSMSHFTYSILIMLTTS